MHISKIFRNFAENFGCMCIALTTELPAEGFKRLIERGYRLLVMKDGNPQSISCQDADILVSTFDYRVPRELIASMPKLRLIANFGAGFNNIDLDACRERGIRVTNTPQPVIEPTAELAFALMIDVARRVSEFDRRIRSGASYFKRVRKTIMDDYHAENATSASQKIFGAAFFDGLECRPKNS